MGLRCSRCNKLQLGRPFSQYCPTCEYALAKEQADENEWQEHLAAVKEKRKVWVKNRKELLAKDPGLKFCTECRYYQDFLDYLSEESGHICHYKFQDIEMVTGAVTDLGTLDCREMREKPKYCGPAGTKWEKR
jgi:hypothetical protein